MPVPNNARRALMRLTMAEVQRLYASYRASVAPVEAAYWAEKDHARRVASFPDYCAKVDALYAAYRAKVDPLMHEAKAKLRKL